MPEGGIDGAIDNATLRYSRSATGGAPFTTAVPTGDLWAAYTLHTKNAFVEIDFIGFFKPKQIASTRTASGDVVDW